MKTIVRRYVLLAVSMGFLLGSSEVNAEWRFWKWFKKDKSDSEQGVALKSEKEAKREADRLSKQREREQKAREREFARSQKKRQEELEKQRRESAKAYKKIKREREKQLRDFARKQEKERKAYLKQYGTKVDSDSGFFIAR